MALNKSGGVAWGPALSSEGMKDHRLTQKKEDGREEGQWGRGYLNMGEDIPGLAWS